MDRTLTLPNGVTVEADSLGELLRVMDALFPPMPEKGFPGVDIDRIHYKLGRVKFLRRASTDARTK